MIECAGLRGAAAQGFRSELERVAASPRTTVLVRAERGTPLDEVAAALHARSVRAAFPFVRLRCALPGVGRAQLEQALAEVGNGTLVVDEPALLPGEVQAGFARALSSRSLDGRPLEARVVAAFADDPEALVAGGVLREDLLYRVNGLALRIPPLRERGADVVALARELLAEVAPRARLRPRGFTRAAERALERHSWPGNDRELEATVECALLRAAGAPIEVEHLSLRHGDGLPAARPAPAPGVAAELPLGDRSWSSVEEALIRRVLSEEGGNKSRCARVLGLHRATLHQKLKSYRIRG